MKKKIIVGVVMGLSLVGNVAWAEKLIDPPNSIIGIGKEPCSTFIETYDAKQRINRKEEKDVVKIIGTFGAYGDFNGTLGGFFASSMMANGDKKVPFNNDDHALSLAYEICKQNPSARFIDVVYVMSQTAFGRKVE
ncbi:MAG: hypothetical protein M0Q44_01530 [Methylobacter sp.]|jgi:hypothetical protein|nr:hypothetical protein [Methylobacter sp.]